MGDEEGDAGKGRYPRKQHQPLENGGENIENRKER